MSNEYSVKDTVGAIIIGRNEGGRLKICIESVLRDVGQIIYVDSGSKDNSVGLAQELGVEVLELDMTVPFTAARARNAGYNRLMALNPGILYVQFVDGDCEVNPDWMEVAYRFLGLRGEIAIVCGRRRERYPHNTVYNLLCDIEWDEPVGETLSCGGDAMMRVEAFSTVNGFRSDLIAGEEPELCVRLRRAGWKIWRLENEMTLHDANITRFSQWWKRVMRGGFTYAQGANELDRQCHKERNRALVWGAVIPLITLLLFATRGSNALYLLALYPFQVFRISLKDNLKFSHSILNSFFITLGKFPEMLGIAKYYFNHMFGRTNRLIEYK